jgi:hypothetical protein
MAGESKVRLLETALTLAIVLASLPFSLRAHDVVTTRITWSREVSRIVYRRCASCHHHGGPAFSLLSYEEARPWAKAIKEEVLMRRMPPWNVVKGFGEFKDERGPTQQELDIIAQWVEGGAPEGNPLYAPPRPTTFTGSLRGHRNERQLALSNGRVLEQPVDAVGIQSARLVPVDNLLAVAMLPGGRIEPLIWLHEANPNSPSAYYFRKTLHFPAGTKIEVTPSNAGVALLLRTAPIAVPKPAH